MRHQQSKLENRSTSSSDFFNRKSPQSQLQQNLHTNHGTPSYLSSGTHHQSSSITQKSTKIFQQPSKVVNEYQMFQPSKLLNENETSKKFSLKGSSSIEFPEFCQTKRQKIPENNFSKHTFGSSCKQVRFQNDSRKNQQISTYQPYPQIYQQFPQSPDPRRSSYSSHKQNLNLFSSKPHFSHQKTFNNSQLLQPITLVKASSDKNLIPNMGVSRFQQTSIIDEPHRILDHIYFTIAHESDLRSVFKKFAADEQRKVSQRLREMFMSLENTLNEIKISFDRQIDQSYQTLLSHLDSLKSMAELMWKNKRNKSFSMLKFQDSNKLQTHQRVGSKSRQRPQSKHGYMKFCQLEIRSPESNNILLNQLVEEDIKMGEYKMAKRFYHNESDFGDEINREKLLKDMFDVSGRISKMMKQCQGMFLDEVLDDKNEKKKGLIWLKQACTENLWKGLNESPNKIWEQNMNEQIYKELNEVKSLVEGFRQNIKYKFIEI